MGRTLVNVTRAWDFDDPVGSEARLRSEAASSEGAERQVWLTQVARALALQGRYAEADAVLDEVEVSGETSSELAVRMLLEPGRVLNSAGDTENALGLFRRAADAARVAGPGPMEALLVDALHMVAIAAEPEDRLRWNEEALRVARSSSDPVARDWDASVLNNIGMCHADDGRLDEALVAFEQALLARRRIGDDARTRVARWMVAWVFRLQGRRDEARVLQEELKAELDRLGLADPYVDEELALLGSPR